MVFKARNLILLFLFMASCQELLFGMSKARRLLTSPTAKDIGAIGATALASGLTIAHYGIAWAPLTTAYNDGKYETFILSLPEVSPPVEQFVKQQLRKSGFSPEQLARIKVKYHFGWAAASNSDNDFILVDINNAWELELALKIKNQKHLKSDYIIKRSTGAIYHEARHILNGDTQNKSYVKDIIKSLCFTELLSLCLKKCFKKPSSVSVKNSLKIPSGIAKAYCTTLCFMNLKRAQEQRADDGMPNDLQALKATKEEFEKLFIEDLCNAEYPDISSPWYKNFDTHPPILDRIKKFDKRIKAIEKTDAWYDPLKDLMPYKEYSIV